MRPIPIPDHCLEAFRTTSPSARRVVIGPPQGHDVTGDIRAVEAIVEDGEFGRVFRCLLMLEPGDFEGLKDHPYVWVMQFSPVMVPWDVRTDGEMWEYPEGDASNV